MKTISETSETCNCNPLHSLRVMILKRWYCILVSFLFCLLFIKQIQHRIAKHVFDIMSQLSREIMSLVARQAPAKTLENRGAFPSRALPELCCRQNGWDPPSFSCWRALFMDLPELVMRNPVCPSKTARYAWVSCHLWLAALHMQITEVLCS